MARARTFVRPGKKIDFKEWVGIPAVSTVLTTATTIQGGSIAFAIPATILRARGAVQCALDDSKQVGDEIRLTFGLGVVSSDAFAAGAGSMPDPNAEVEYPWLWWNTMFLRAEGTGAQEAWGSSVVRLDVDTKAMRKVKPGQSLVWVAQSTTVVGAPVTNIDFLTGRVLIGT